MRQLTKRVEGLEQKITDESAPSHEVRIWLGLEEGTVEQPDPMIDWATVNLSHLPRDIQE